MATLARLDVKLGLNSAAYTAGLKRSTQRTDAFRRTALRLGATLVGVLGARQLLRGIRNIGRAFIAQEDAVQGLRASLIATGKDGEESLQILTRSAAELQKITRQGDEAIIEATASLAQLAPALDTAELQRAQSAIIGIAETFTKGDLESAALLIGKTVGSTTNALTRYGIQVDTAADAQTKMAQVIEASNAFFEVAEARADTTGGALAQLVNNFGDIKEAIGQVLATRTGFKVFLQRVSTTLADIATILSGSTPQIKRMFTLVGTIAANAYSAAIAAGLAKLADRAIQALSGLPMILVADAIVLADGLQQIFSKAALEAGANIQGATIELGEMAENIRTQIESDAPGTLDPIITETLRMTETLKDMAFDAGEGFVRAFIRGTESVFDLLVNTLSRFAEDLVIGSIEKKLNIGATANSSEAIVASGAPSPAAMVVNQTVNLNAGFVDGASGANWLRANKGAVALALREAAQDAGGVRRLLG